MIATFSLLTPSRASNLAWKHTPPKFASIQNRNTHLFEFLFGGFHGAPVLLRRLRVAMNNFLLNIQSWDLFGLFGDTVKFIRSFLELFQLDIQLLEQNKFKLPDRVLPILRLSDRPFQQPCDGIDKQFRHTFPTKHFLAMHRNHRGCGFERTVPSEGWNLSLTLKK